MVPVEATEKVCVCQSAPPAVTVPVNVADCDLAAAGTISASASASSGSATRERCNGVVERMTLRHWRRAEWSAPRAADDVTNRNASRPGGPEPR